MTVPARCTVRWAGLSLDSPALDALLTAADHERADRFRGLADRARSRVATALIRTAAARHIGLAPAQVPIDRRCADCGRDHGKPVVVGSDLHVSVSHAGDWIVLATSLDAAVGVDVEALDQPDPDPTVLDLALTAAERAEFARAEHPKRWFLQRWTLKEATVKASGEGLRLPLHEIDPATGGAVPLDAPAGHVAAVAALAARLEVTTAPTDDPF